MAAVLLLMLFYCFYSFTVLLPVQVVYGCSVVVDVVAVDMY